MFKILLLVCIIGASIEALPVKQPSRINPPRSAKTTPRPLRNRPTPPETENAEEFSGPSGSGSSQRESLRELIAKSAVEIVTAHASSSIASAASTQSP